MEPGSRAVIGTDATIQQNGGEDMLSTWIARSAAAAALMLATSASAAAAPNDNTSFAQSYAANDVASVTATSQLISCYSPEVTYFDTLVAGYPGGGMSLCPGATTGEQIQGFATQDVSNPP